MIYDSLVMDAPTSRFLFDFFLINVIQRIFGNQNRWYQQGGIVMQKNILKPKTKKIQFSLQAAEAQKVSLVGDFNNWNPDADPMQ